MHPNLESLAAVLNDFPGIQTGEGQETEGHWYITFSVEHTEAGWRSLEFIAWAVSDLKRGSYSVILEATAIPPYLNTPGECLLFIFRGRINTVDDKGGLANIAALFSEWKEDYIPVQAGDENQR